MKFSTEAVEKLAEIMVQERNKMGVEGQGIREVERTMRELVREVGAQALGKYLEQQDEQVREQEVVCACGEAMTYLCKRPATIVSVFGRVRSHRGYDLCEQCHARQSPLDRRIGIEAGQETAGLAEGLALAGVEIAFEEATRWLAPYLLFRVSDNPLRKETERFGQLPEVQETAWKENSQAEAWLQRGQCELGQQPGRLDGVMAPLVGEWRELKNIAWYRGEQVGSYQKRRRHAKRVGEQNDLQALRFTKRSPPLPTTKNAGTLPASASSSTASEVARSKARGNRLPPCASNAPALVGPNLVRG